MDQTRLEYFLAVADARTLSEAALRLHISQPSLSAALRTFERECGFPVFDRVNKRLVLNDAGRQLVPHARATAAALRGAEACAQQLRGLSTGEVTIACSLTVPMVMCKLIADFRLVHPDITVTLESSSGSRNVAAAVMERRAELGVVHGTWDEDGRESIPVHEDQLVLLVKADHPLSGRDHVTLEDLDGLDIITSNANSYSGRLLRDAVASGVTPRPVVHCPHRAAVPQLVKFGAGAAVVAGTVYSADDPAVRSIPFAPRQPIPISLIYRPGSQTPATNAFIAAVRERVGTPASPAPGRLPAPA